MKIEILETIVLALAKDNKEGCTAALKEILEQNASTIKGSKIYEIIGLALASAMEVEEETKETLHPRLTEESKKKLEFLGEILPHIEKNLESILNVFLQLNVELSNIFIMQLAYSEKYQERVRKHLIKSFSTYLHNGQIVNMVIDLPEFDPNIVGELAFELEKLGRLQKKELTEKEFDHPKENYFQVILKILNTGNVTRINTSLFENVFSVQSDYRTDFSILNVLKEYLEYDEISQSVNKAAVFDSLVKKQNFPILEAWIKDEKFFPSEDKNPKDSLVEIFKKMNKFKVFIHYILEKYQENSKWSSLLMDLVTDIDYDCLLLKCFPSDIVYIITLSKDIQNKKEGNEVNLIMKKVIEKAKKYEIADHYYEDFLVSLLERDCYTSSIQKILCDYNVDLTYQPMHILGSHSLAYWIAWLGNKEVLSTFLEKENLPSIFYGNVGEITLSSLCFAAGDMERGLKEFQNLNLLSEAEKINLQTIGKFEVDYEEIFVYQDRVTQIINSILRMEDTDEQTKKNLIATIILDKKVEFVNLGLFELLNELYGEEELKILYENLKNRTFISYRKVEDVGIDRVVAVEISKEEEIQDTVTKYIEKSFVPKRVQKNN